jgi:hypothetical protein
MAVAIIEEMQDGNIFDTDAISLISIIGRTLKVELDQDAVRNYVAQRMHEVTKAKYETSIVIKIQHNNDFDNLPPDEVIADAVKRDIQEADWFDSKTDSGAHIGPTSISIDVISLEL